MRKRYDTLLSAESQRCAKVSEGVPGADWGMARCTVMNPETRIPMEMITADTMSDWPRRRNRRPFVLLPCHSDMLRDSVVRDCFSPFIDPQEAVLDPLPGVLITGRGVWHTLVGACASSALTRRATCVAATSCTAPQAAVWVER
jgi:hypothetical protein